MHHLEARRRYRSWHRGSHWDLIRIDTALSGFFARKTAYRYLDWLRLNGISKVPPECQVLARRDIINDALSPDGIGQFIDASAMDNGVIITKVHDTL